MPPLALIRLPYTSMEKYITLLSKIYFPVIVGIAEQFVVDCLIMVH